MNCLRFFQDDGSLVSVFQMQNSLRGLFVQDCEADVTRKWQIESNCFATFTLHELK